MAKHTNDITRARTYTPFTSPRSFMDAAAQRAAADLARDGKKSRDASDVARWEDEGGTTKPPAQGPQLKPLAARFALSGRASYDSLQRSHVEGMMASPDVRVDAETLMPQRALASSIEERARLRMSSRKAPAHGSGRQRGRRTMGRHGNRP